jgi:hypothetical protein
MAPVTTITTTPPRDIIISVRNIFSRGKNEILGLLDEIITDYNGKYSYYSIYNPSYTLDAATVGSYNTKIATITTKITALDVLMVTLMQNLYIQGLVTSTKQPANYADDMTKLKDNKKYLSDLINKTPAERLKHATFPNNIRRDVLNNVDLSYEASIIDLSFSFIANEISKCLVLETACIKNLNVIMNNVQLDSVDISTFNINYKNVVYEKDSIRIKNAKNAFLEEAESYLSDFDSCYNSLLYLNKKVKEYEATRTNLNGVFNTFLEIAKNSVEANSIIIRSNVIAFDSAYNAIDSSCKTFIDSYREYLSEFIKTVVDLHMLISEYLQKDLLNPENVILQSDIKEVKDNVENYKATCDYLRSLLIGMKDCISSVLTNNDNRGLSPQAQPDSDFIEPSFSPNPNSPSPSASTSPSASASPSYSTSPSDSASPSYSPSPSDSPSAQVQGSVADSEDATGCNEYTTSIFTILKKYSVTFGISNTIHLISKKLDESIAKIDNKTLHTNESKVKFYTKYYSDLTKDPSDKLASAITTNNRYDARIKELNNILMIEKGKYDSLNSNFHKSVYEVYSTIFGENKVIADRITAKKDSQAGDNLLLNYTQKNNNTLNSIYHYFLIYFYYFLVLCTIYFLYSKRDMNFYVKIFIIICLFIYPRYILTAEKYVYHHLLYLYRLTLGIAGDNILNTNNPVEFPTLPSKPKPPQDEDVISPKNDTNTGNTASFGNGVSFGNTVITPNGSISNNTSGQNNTGSNGAIVGNTSTVETPEPTFDYYADNMEDEDYKDTLKMGYSELSQ